MTSACAAFSSFDTTTTGGATKRIPGLEILPLKTAFVRQHDWTEQVRARLFELMQLPAGWDGYRAKPVSRENAVFALSLLSAVMNQRMPVPSIVPTVSGSLRIEWHTLRGDVELRINRPNSVHAWFSCVDEEDEPEVDLTFDFKIVSAWLNDIKEIDVALERAAA